MKNYTKLSEFATKESRTQIKIQIFDCEFLEFFACGRRFGYLFYSGRQVILAIGVEKWEGGRI